jgi:hypothetical protein
VIVGCWGHTTRTTGGLASGTINSTVIESAPLIGPLLSVIFLGHGICAPKVVDPQARLVFEHLAGHLHVVG